ncbi:AbiTii domain-containing protein [Luteibacter jiangsuensis]
MAQPIVIQLQELASDSSHDINDLLRKGLMVATKLDLKEFREWIIAELNGYAGGGEPVPDYRVVHGDLRVENPFHGPQPFLVPSELHDHVTKIKVSESVASIQQLIEGSKKGHLVYYFPPGDRKDAHVDAG